jgi:hypothetical protein
MLSRPGYADFVFAFHDGDEIGPRMLARIAKHTGLKTGDLCREPNLALVVKAVFPDGLPAPARRAVTA